MFSYDCCHGFILGPHLYVVVESNWVGYMYSVLDLNTILKYQVLYLSISILCYLLLLLNYNYLITLVTLQIQIINTKYTH